MASDLSVRFLGTRGSIPATGPEFNGVGGATSCVVVEAGSRDLIFDAGSGLTRWSDVIMERYQAQGGPVSSHLFFTHCHLDHLIGLPYYSPLFLPDSRVRLYGPRSTQFDSFREAIEQFIHPPFFPVPMYEMAADIQFHDFSEPDCALFCHGVDEPTLTRPVGDDDGETVPEGQVEVSVESQRGYNHPKSGVNHYRIQYEDKTVVYATDTEAYPQGDRRLIEFAEGADVLIHDAMYTDDQYVSRPSAQGFGHSAVSDAAAVAKEAGVDQLFLFHHDPTNDDTTLTELEEQGQETFAQTSLARDGLTYDV
jgi:ribonuclease BN (tRNA processing enzyme)